MIPYIILHIHSFSPRSPLDTIFIALRIRGVGKECGEGCKVLELLDVTSSKYEAGAPMLAAVEALVAANPEAKPGPAALRLGQGVWEVPC